jgi:predicted metal-dependent hydrolase
VQFGSTRIDYSVIRSKRRKKTIQITLDANEGVLVAAPLRAAAKVVEDVVRRRAGWIVRKSTESVLCARPKQFVSGESLPYLGRQVRLFVEHDSSRRVDVRFDHWSFRIGVPAHLNGDDRRPAIAKAVAVWYRRRAQARLEARVERWAGIIGCPTPRVLTRDQRQRWGSCGPDGTLRFNWRIVMAEPALIDYVVVHELMHIRIRNHSQGFWAAVAGAMPDFKLRRKRLRETGPYLSV